MNLGSGGGFSVLEVLTPAESVVGHADPAHVRARRAGDPPVLVASNERALELLGWRPAHGTLDADDRIGLDLMQRQRAGAAS